MAQKCPHRVRYPRQGAPKKALLLCKVIGSVTTKAGHQPRNILCIPTPDVCIANHADYH